MAVAPAQSGAPLYAFENQEGHGSHRDLAAARAQLEVLWARLDGDVEQLRALERGDPESWQFLLRYATDGPLSIQWYEDRRPKLESKQRRYNALVMTIVLFVFGLAFLLPFQPLLMVLLQDKLSLGDAAPSTGVVDVAALLGVLASGTTIALRLSAMGVRYRQQAAVFHRASAALKEQLYGLETEWRDKPLVEEVDGAMRLRPELDAAIRQAVGQAQATMSDERDAFFDTLIMDVNALTDGASGMADALSARAVFRGDTRSNYAQRRRDLDDQMAQAQLECETVKAKIGVLEQELAKASEDAVPGHKQAILELRLALQEADQRKRQLDAQQRTLRG